MPRGKECRCICPSCKTPLIARQGNIKEWHFAHASRSVYLKTEKECSFSFYVSVRMMARQVIRGQLEIIVPAYEDAIAEYIERYDGYISVPFTIAEQQKISLTNISVEKMFLGIPVDIVGKVGDFSFIIYFCHPGREIPEVLYNPLGKRCGIISISLESTAMLFSKAKSEKHSYQKYLQDFLANDLDSKRWLFHPRFLKSKDEAKQRLREKKKELEKKFDNPKKEVSRRRDDSQNDEIYSNLISEKSSKKLANYQCVICNVSWKNWDQGANICPKCGEHLYVSFKGNVENKT